MDGVLNELFDYIRKLELRRNAHLLRMDDGVSELLLEEDEKMLRWLKEYTELKFIASSNLDPSCKAHVMSRGEYDSLSEEEKRNGHYYLIY